MSISSLVLNTSIENLNSNQLAHLQKQYIQNNYFYTKHFEHIKLPHFSAQSYTRNFNIQLLDANGFRLDKSNSYPVLPNTIIQNKGFINLSIDGIKWRFFITKHSKKNMYIVIGEKIKNRDALIHKITRDDLLILLLIFPLSGILIWFTVGRSLSPLNQITKEIKTRNPYHLKHVDLDNIPDEIQPLTSEINLLLNRLKEGLSREKTFAADAAHELRTPLATIKTLAQTTLAQHPNDEILSLLNKIIQNVDRGSHVVHQLMNMSKTMPEALVLSEFNSLDLEKIAKETLSDMIQDALEKNMDIELESSPNVPKIKGNKIALGILIRNLIDNAIRYSFPDTSIFVHIYKSEQNVVLEVRDQGPGIPKSKQDKVFDRFYRAHEPKYQGTGLGLAIVKQIANLHQAQITLESPYRKKGVIIRVFFPLVSS
jgi:two-component system sensor histidine kinase QseC